MRPQPALPLGERLKRATMRTQPRGMFQRFTDRSRRAVHLAHEEARLLRHDYVGTEHILLGLLYEGEGVAATALNSMGISWQDARARVEEIVGYGPGTVTGTIPFAPGARKALGLSLREAQLSGHRYLGTGHLLLGLLHDGESTAAQVLSELGADRARVREHVTDLYGERERVNREAGRIRLAIPQDLVATAEELAEVRRQKEAAFGEGDLEAAAALRDRERRLLADKIRLERQWTAGVDTQTVMSENRLLRREIDRLRGLLRQRGIEPDDGTAQSG
jgi:ATP-dependent Clp protease ATP-binding subunit ClpC